MPPANRERRPGAGARSRLAPTGGVAAHASATDSAAPAARGDGTSGRGDSVARAYEQLRELIVSGRLAPGSRIIESEIAERLGVSRTPARSALHRLQQEGYVSAVDRAKERRLVVAPLTHDDARELFHIVGQLEGLAVRSSAELPEGPRKKVVAELRRWNDALARAAREPRPDALEVFQLDMRFHQTYVAGGAGPRLVALHAAIKPQAERYARLYTSSLMDEITTSVEEHAVIIAQVAAGDADAAQQAVDRNWRNAAARLSKVIRTLGERGSW